MPIVGDVRMTKLALFQRRPFKTRNADEYDLEQVLNLFINPSEGLISPFDYENIIIKGRMGSGKTMYLRANHAYYLYGLVPSLLNNDRDIILPILIRLNNFQHLKDPGEIYRAIIIKIIEEITSIYLHLLDAHKLVELHTGIKCIASKINSSSQLSLSIKQLSKLGSEEYVERISTEFGVKGDLKHSFLNLSANWKKNNLTELKTKPNPGIKDIEECYSNLLEGYNGKILLLIDEAGSLDNKFFRNDENDTAHFEILMNQFRTASFIRTKIAVYPNSYSDLLTETRYGDIIKLEHFVKTENEYKSYRDKVISIIESYINNEFDNDHFTVSDIFEINTTELTNDSIEQIIFASHGNIRRLINLLDLSMTEAYKEHSDILTVNKKDSVNAIMNHALDIESLFSDNEKIFLQKIVEACRARSTYRFRFPAMSPVLYKYTNKSEEFNIINVDEVGSGRRGNTYSFDYAYCVLKNIPSHYISGTEKLDRDRSLQNGTWVTRVTQLNQEIIEQAELPGKIEGEIEFLKDGSGFIKSDDGNRYFFTVSYIIESDQNKAIFLKKRLRFYPSKMEDTKMAINIEVL